MRLDEQQRALRDLARDLFADASPPRRLRELWGGAERGDVAWRRYADAGLTGLVLPEVRGGSGATFREAAIVLDEAGYAGVPEPLLECAYVAAPVLAAVRTELASQFLPAVSDGDAVIAVQLEGSPYVLDADTADLLLVEAGGRLHALTRHASEPVAVEDRARRVFEVHAVVAANAALTTDAAVLAAAHDRATVGTAALLTGVVRRLLDLSLEHARTRHQFDRPIGAFQAVSHPLAEVHVALTAAQAATWYAAGSIADARPDAPHAAAVAKVSAADAFALADRVALQVHAGIGFTWEHDLHLWAKRGQALSASYGTAREHRTRLAARLLDEEAP